MDFQQLKEKALSLPAAPGVYLMKNKEDTVIYVGKAKKLKNRVSQYFQDTASHNLKTRTMVSKIHHFDVIVAASEFEALVLECSLIKRHQPKYNILLKDGKGYPYLRLNMKEAYPAITMVNKPDKDDAAYYGPFGSRGVTQGVLDSINAALQIPTCNRRFPQDIGKGRPCLNYHMNQCVGWCRGEATQDDYRAVMEQARQLLQGNYKSLASDIRRDMIAAGEELNFETAAILRDRLLAIESLGKKQLVTAGNPADTDVIGFAQTETKACFTVLHFSDGNLLDKDYEIFASTEDPEQTVISLIKQYYFTRGFAPRSILIPFDFEDREMLEQLLEENYHRKISIRVPERGDKHRLVELAVKNAREEAERLTDKDERLNATVNILGKMLGILPPKRIESFDISNLQNSDIVAAMVVFVDGMPRRSEYKRYKVNDLESPDDYASMDQVVRRRFVHYLAQDKGFESPPDLLLIDGGVNHAKVAVSVLAEMNLSFPVFGMVKDDRHRTRALVTADGCEIRIDNQPSVFALIGNIQEETHRFAITYHRKLRSKRLRYSELDAIPGVGPKRKQILLKAFKSLTALAEASVPELERFVPSDVATAVYDHFKKKG